MKKSTIAVHAGYHGNDQNSMAVPIYQTTAYEFDSTTHAAELFDLKQLGNIYARLTNPTNEVLEKRFAELENGAAAIATASGTSAIFYAIANVAEAGDNILVAQQAYGGTITLTGHTLRRFGIEARYFDIRDLEAMESMIDNRTKLIFFEVIPNPSVELTDIDKIVSIADKHRVLLCADNTVATPIICAPLDLGADIVVHSTSKYTTGQGLALGGIMIESRSITEKLENNSRYRHFTEPDKSYHGLVYTKTGLPPFSLRARLSLLRDFGATPSPFNSWLFIQGLETLPIRMVQHSKSALEVAKFLNTHPKVKRVNYPGLPDNPDFKLCQKYFKDGMASGLLSFELDSREEAQRVADSFKLFKLVANIGDSKSIATHPASTTHQQLSEQELLDAGVTGGLIRLSIGLEDPSDLIDDLEQAIG